MRNLLLSYWLPAVFIIYAQWASSTYKITSTGGNPKPHATVATKGTKHSVIIIETRLLEMAIYDKILV